MAKLKSLTITERGYAGHFAGWRNCDYRRNTLIEYGTRRIIVSSIGDYYLFEPDGPQEIGHDRYFETKVFPAHLVEGYWVADTTREISIESPNQINKETLTDSSFQTFNLMDNQHDDVVKEITEKLMANEIDLNN